MEKGPDNSQKREVGTDNSDTDTDTAMLEVLLAELGFEETPELAEARQEVLAALGERATDPTRKHMAWRELLRIGEALVDDATVGLDDMHKRAGMHVALQIHEAGILRDAGLRADYVRSLQRVGELSTTTGHSSTADGIKDVLDLLAQN